MNSLDLYDFDGTIYAGDSSVDFWLFCVKRQWSLLRYLPRQLWGVAGMKLGFFRGEKGKSHFFSFLRRVRDPEAVVEAFWTENRDKLADWFLARDREALSVVVSASPAFLLEPICRDQGVSALLATRMDIHTGRIDGQNCKGKEKLRRLSEWMEANGTCEIRSAYSDAPGADAPMLQAAKQAYLVKKGQVVPYTEKTH